MEADLKRDDAEEMKAGSSVEQAGSSQAQASAVPKDPERLAILEKIKEYEKQGLWTKDVENDPPTVPLEPGQVDFLNKKPWNWIMMKVVNSMARKFINKMIKGGQLVIKDVVGLEENFIPLEKQGAVITCNHFNPFDNFAVYKALEGHIRHNELYKVIREGNFTSMPGLFGLFFRHCNTLPLSSNFSVLKEFMAAVDTLLNRGDKVLVYAEQGMWWNYRKPRPVTPGAYTFAAKNNVPVIPMFITMEDSSVIGPDGFPVQEYTVHILKPIYPDESLSVKQNARMMADRNYEAWKELYESVYGIPLVYGED